MKRIIQIEKVLKLTTRTHWPIYLPSAESIKKLFYAAVDLQQKRGRRYGLLFPLSFWSQLTIQERDEARQRLKEIRAANAAEKKRARLKRRRFYARERRGRRGMASI